MAKPKVFISWSGSRARHFAEFLQTWLPIVIQGVAPDWSPNIEKGSDWYSSLWDMLRASADTQSGLVLLTPENLGSTWLLFEAGVLASSEDKKPRVFTLLLGGLEPGDVSGPLGKLQHTVPTKEDVRRLIGDLNDLLVEEARLDESVLDGAVDANWPTFKAALEDFPAAPKATEVPRTDDLLKEILDTLRHLAPEERKSPKEKKPPPLDEDFIRVATRLIKKGVEPTELLDLVGGIERGRREGVHYTRLRPSYKAYFEWLAEQVKKRGEQ